ncbi:MAG: sulfite exporter TauE/SafE family protein [Ignavibacteria bacterium]|nr:sulfite exporter TauE/SafE family protein [Ignavibacteria bacterium]
MELNNILIIALIGIVGGVLSGFLGLGGAVIIIPALVFILGYSQQMAQGTTLLMLVMPVGSLAAYQYYKAGNADIKTALILGAAFFISAYVSAKYVTHIPQEMLRKIFAVVLVVIAVKMFFQK